MNHSAFKHRQSYMRGVIHVDKWSGINLCERYHSIHIAEVIIAHHSDNYVINLI